MVVFRAGLLPDDGTSPLQNYEATTPLPVDCIMDLQDPELVMRLLSYDDDDAFAVPRPLSTLAMLQMGPFSPFDAFVYTNAPTTSIERTYDACKKQFLDAFASESASDQQFKMQQQFDAIPVHFMNHVRQEAQTYVTMEEVVPHLFGLKIVGGAPQIGTDTGHCLTKHVAEAKRKLHAQVAEKYPGLRMSLRSFERRIKFFLYVGYAIESLKLKLLTGDEVCMEMGRHGDKRLEKWVLASSSMAMVSSAIHCGFILLDSICEYNEEIDPARTCLLSILQEHDGEKTAIGLRELLPVCEERKSEFALAASRAVVDGFEDINEKKMSIRDYRVCAFAAAYYSDFTRHSVIQPVPRATIPVAEARLIAKGKVEDMVDDLVNEMIEDGCMPSDLTHSKTISLLAKYFRMALKAKLGS